MTCSNQNKSKQKTLTDYLRLHLKLFEYIKITVAMSNGFCITIYKQL